jgi:hypothetical protein
MVKLGVDKHTMLVRQRFLEVEVSVHHRDEA